jgi:hypothetical protein
MKPGLLVRLMIGAWLAIMLLLAIEDRTYQQRCATAMPTTCGSSRGMGQ